MKKHILIATTLALLGMECAYSNCSQMSTEDEQCASIPDPEQNIANCKSYMFPYPICYKNAQGTRKNFTRAANAKMAMSLHLTRILQQWDATAAVHTYASRAAW